MKPLRTPLTPEQREQLTQYLADLSGRVTKYESAIERRDSLLAKQSELQQTIPSLQTNLDPMNRDAIREIAEMQSQLAAISATLMADNLVDTAEQLLGNCVRGARQLLSPIAREEHRGLADEVTALLLPYCRHETEARHRARECRLVSESAHKIACQWCDSPNSANRVLDYVRRLLEGENPF